jgi:diacylglycerol kinase (ATP)
MVDADGSMHRATSVIVTKGRLYAGRFVIAPEARLADPLLHVALFGRAGRFAAVRYLAALMLRVLHCLSDGTIATARKISIAPAMSASSGFFIVEIDGELGGRLLLVVEIAEEPLLLLHPRFAGRPHGPGTSPQCSCLRL